MIRLRLGLEQSLDGVHHRVYNGVEVAPDTKTELFNLERQ